MDRIIEFEGIQNCRDLGGLQNGEGCKIPQGKLLRSANLTQATEADGRKLKEIGINEIVDLRTALEIYQMDDVAFEGIEHHWSPIFVEKVSGISHEEPPEDDFDIETVDMRNTYQYITTDEGTRANLGKALTEIMEHDFVKGGVIWHCSEGKDRCGLISAILLMILGVDRKTVMDDYLMTNLVNGPKAEKIYHQIIAEGRDPMIAENLRNVFLAKEEYLGELFTAIDSYGSLVNYLTEGLSIRKETIGRFRKEMLG